MLAPGTRGKRREKLMTEKCEIPVLDSGSEVGVWQRVEQVRPSGPRRLGTGKEAGTVSCKGHPAFHITWQ